MERKGHEADQTVTPGFALSALTIGLDSLNSVVMALEQKAEKGNLSGYNLAVIQILSSTLKGHVNAINLLLARVVAIDPLRKK